MLSTFLSLFPLLTNPNMLLFSSVHSFFPPSPLSILSSFPLSHFPFLLLLLPNSLLLPYSLSHSSPHSSTPLPPHSFPNHVTPHLLIPLHLSQPPSSVLPFFTSLFYSIPTSPPSSPFLLIPTTSPLIPTSPHTKSLPLILPPHFTIVSLTTPPHPLPHCLLNRLPHPSPPFPSHGRSCHV